MGTSNWLHRLLQANLLLAASVSTRSTAARHQTQPLQLDTMLWSAEHLLANRGVMRTPSGPTAAVAKAFLTLNESNRGGPGAAWEALPEYDPTARPRYYSVMNKSATPPSGDKHDVRRERLLRHVSTASCAWFSDCCCCCHLHAVSRLRVVLLAMQRRVWEGCSATARRPLRALLLGCLP